MKKHREGEGVGVGGEGVGEEVLGEIVPAHWLWWVVRAAVYSGECWVICQCVEPPFGELGHLESQCSAMHVEQDSGQGEHQMTIFPDMETEKYRFLDRMALQRVLKRKCITSQASVQQDHSHSTATRWKIQMAKQAKIFSGILLVSQKG
ncbi:uncharacterized protein LOC107839967 isoform X3 [Capsicum annuum]|uniref:uncharacterized protein LOC107839967 isoform X3 n=1 Tax=Capsicum annuum TaxID=4072 RepID=UPI001FB1980B|nr:uncharacterized protein LOC107839967 isoform X3 [Capsicum annuum]